MSKQPDMDRQIKEEDLHAFIDGELPADYARVVEAAIKADPDLAAMVATYRQDKMFMKRLYGPLINRPVPPHLTDLANGGARPDIRQPLLSRSGWRRLAVATATMALVVAGGALLRDIPGGDIVHEALDARSHYLALNGDIDRYNDALSHIVSSRVKVPDLSRAGYALAGVGVQGETATIAYRDPQGKLFTIYLRGSDGSVRFDQFKQAGLRICIWQDDRLSLVMAGEMSAAVMQKLASLAYIGLTA